MPPGKKLAAASAHKRKPGDSIDPSISAGGSATTSKKAKKTKKPFPGKIGWSLTIAQLREEAEARGIGLENVKQDKHSLLGVLGEGSLSVIALNRKQQNSKSQKAEDVSNGAAKQKKESTTKVAASKQQKKEEEESTAKAAAKVSKKPDPSTTKSKPASANPKNPPADSLEKKPAAKMAADKIKKTISRSEAKQPPPAPTSKKSSITTDKAVGPADYPRISNKLTLAQLKEEAIARKIDPKNVPKLKADLLHHLVEGSIHVKETTIYKEYENLLEKVAEEKEQLYEDSWKKKQATEARKEALRMEKYEKEQKKRQEEQRQRMEEREREKEHQKTLHTHSFPRVHKHPLANTKDLCTHGGPRHGICDLCDSRRTPEGFLVFSFRNPNPGVYTCEKCDWDICHDCFQMENKSDEEKKRIMMEQKKKAEAARRKREEEARKWEELERKREEEERNRWDARKRFKAKTIKPSAKNKNISSKLKYTVWCSDGYDNDGWHSYEGEPTKEFDTTWSTKKEANDRAEYLFFWKNVWGLDPHEIGDDYSGPDILPTENDGMKKWTVSPPDSTRWTVGVVPAEAYPHLENASKRRHNYDDEREPKRYSEDSDDSEDYNTVFF